MTSKMISKLYRLKLADELREFIETLPVSDLIETQTGNFVYSGIGTVSTGVNKFPICLRIRKQKSEMLMRVDSRFIKFEVPFNDEEERRIASEYFVEAVQKCLN